MERHTARPSPLHNMHGVHTGAPTTTRPFTSGESRNHPLVVRYARFNFPPSTSLGMYVRTTSIPVRDVLVCTSSSYGCKLHTCWMTRRKVKRGYVSHRPIDGPASFPHNHNVVIEAVATHRPNDDSICLATVTASHLCSIAWILRVVAPEANMRRVRLNPNPTTDQPTWVRMLVWKDSCGSKKNDSE